jgi:protease I
MTENNNEIRLIKDKINLYFKGTYEGNIDQLQCAFHPEARITGNIKGQYYDWTLNEFIQRVSSLPTSEHKGEVYNKEIVYLDQTHDAAIVKARVAVGGLIFIDYITLLKIKDEWFIRNKSFCVEE